MKTKIIKAALNWKPPYPPIEGITRDQMLFALIELVKELIEEVNKDISGRNINCPCRKILVQLADYDQTPDIKTISQ